MPFGTITGENMNGPYYMAVHYLPSGLQVKKKLKKSLVVLRIFISLYKQNNITMITTPNPVKTKKLVWGKKGKEVSGWLKLKDGTKTHFTINKDGEWEQWGNTRDNLCLTVNFVENLRNFLLYGE